MSRPNSLEIFVDCLKKVPDLRSKQGVSHPFHTALAVIFLGLLANISTLAEIQRWAEIIFRNSVISLSLRTKRGKEKFPTL
jgi:hypothetical protein